MRGVMLEVPEELLAERRRIGIDTHDEVWDGVLHMVPPPASRHGLLQAELCSVLLRIAKRRGLCVMTEAGLFDPEQGLENYRVPDIVVAATDRISTRGVEGVAELVVEILSPNDESREKLPFYARMGVREVWLIDPVTREIEIYRAAEGLPVRVEGPLRSILGIDVAAVDGTLRISDSGIVDEI